MFLNHPLSTGVEMTIERGFKERMTAGLEFMYVRKDRQRGSSDRGMTITGRGREGKRIDGNRAF